MSPDESVNSACVSCWEVTLTAPFSSLAVKPVVSPETVTPSAAIWLPLYAEVSVCAAEASVFVVSVPVLLSVTEAGAADVSEWKKPFASSSYRRSSVYSSPAPPDGVMVYAPVSSAGSSVTKDRAKPGSPSPPSTVRPSASSPTISPPVTVVVFVPLETVNESKLVVRR